VEVDFSDLVDSNTAVIEKPKSKEIDFSDLAKSNQQQPTFTPEEVGKHFDDALNTAVSQKIPFDKAKQYTVPPEKVEPKDRAYTEVMNALVKSNPSSIYQNNNQNSTMYSELASKWHGSWGAMAENLDHIMGWMSKWGERITGIESDFNYQTGKKMTPEEVVVANQDFAQKHPDISEFINKYGIAPGAFFANVAKESNANKDYYAQKALEHGPSFMRELIGEMGGFPAGVAEWYLDIPYAFAKGEAESQARGEGEISQLYHGLYEATVRGVLGKIFDGLASYSRPEKAAAMGTMFTAQTAMQGGGITESIKSGIVGTFIGATGGKEKSLDLFEDIKVRQTKALEVGDEMLKKEGVEPATVPEKPPTMPVEAKTTETKPVEPVKAEPEPTTPSIKVETPKAKVTSIKNEITDQKRVEFGLTPAMEEARKANQTTWDNAMRTIEDNPRVADNLIDELKTKPRVLSDEENGILLHKQIDLETERYSLENKMDSLLESGDEQVKAETRTQIDKVQDELQDVYDVAKSSGREWGRSGQFRQRLADENYSLVAMEKRARASKERKLTPEEQATIKQQHDRIIALESQIKELEKNRIIRKVLSARPPKSANPSDSGFGTRNRLFTKDKADTARERLRKLTFGSASAGLNPEGLVELAKIGGYYVEAGLREFSAWSEQMIKDLGKDIEPHLKEIWPEIQNRLGVAARKDIVEKMQKKAAEGKKLPAMTGFINQLSESFVEGGIKDRDELIDAVHKELKTLAPDIERREVMDAISGYGDYRPLTKTEVKNQLRDLKGQMQQVAKLEDMQAGQPPSRTGIERRIPSDEERRLIKLVNDAKREFQIPISDPDTQLKSSLDELKTRLINRTKELQEKLDKGDFETKPTRKPIALDEEAMALKVEKEKVVQQYEQARYDDMMAKRTNTEKVFSVLQKIRRAFILSSPAIFGKLSAAAIVREITTPVEDILSSGIRKIIPSIAEKAPRMGEGFRPATEFRAKKGSIRNIFKDMSDMLRTGNLDLDVLYKKRPARDRSFLDFFGSIHGALKTVPKRAEFIRSFEKRMRWNEKEGIDVTNPLEEARIGLEAYEDANRSIFMNQDNFMVQAYRGLIARLSQKDPETGKTPLPNQVAKALIQNQLPIVSVPSNIVSEFMAYHFGFFTGSIRAARAYIKGTNVMTPKEGDLIMRLLAKGSFGLALLAYGMFNSKNIGGYWQPGEKRKPGDVPVEGMKVEGYTIPKVLLHAPAIMQIQVGATIMRIAQAEMRKKGIAQTEADAFAYFRAMTGSVESVPFVREAVDISKLMNAGDKQLKELVGEEIMSQTVPQAAQWTARQLDKDTRGDTIKRKPRNLKESIEMGIPVLREDVPKKK
jgi:hypothetical protein